MARRPCVWFQDSDQAEYQGEGTTLAELRNTTKCESGYLQMKSADGTVTAFRQPNYILENGNEYNFMYGGSANGDKTIKVKMVEKGDEVIVLTIEPSDNPLHLQIKSKICEVDWLRGSKKRLANQLEFEPLDLYRLYDDAGSLIGDTRSLKSHQVYHFRVPLKLTAESGHRWSIRQLEELRIKFRDVTTVEQLYFHKRGSHTPSAACVELVKKLEMLDPNVFARYDGLFEQRKAQGTTELNQEETDFLQDELVKMLYMLTKYNNVESPVDMFVLLLLRRLGFFSDWLVAFPQFKLELHFGSTVKEAIADMTIMDVISFLRMAVLEDKRVLSELLNSEPQLMAELIALYQANIARSTAQQASTSTATSSDTSTGAPADQEDPDGGPIIGVRVSGTRFWFYHLADPATVLSAMSSNTAANVDTEVTRLGSANGLNFLLPDHRKVVIEVLDQILQEFQQSGLHAARRLSYAPQTPSTTAKARG